MLQHPESSARKHSFRGDNKMHLLVSRAVLSSFAATALSSAFALSTFAAGAPPATPATGSGPTSAISNAGTVSGTPSITPSSPLGYYIWRDDERVHLATHGPGDEHHFVGRLHSDGLFQNVDSSKLEPDDSYRLEDGGHTLVIDFMTYRATDDIAFTVTGEHVRLDLMLDGTAVGTGQI